MEGVGFIKTSRHFKCVVLCLPWEEMLGLLHPQNKFEKLESDISDWMYPNLIYGQCLLRLSNSLKIDHRELLLSRNFGRTHPSLTL